MKGLKELGMSFVYAFRGIVSCIRSERNMRIHITCMFYMYFYLLIYDFFEVSRTQFALLFVACAAVVMGELINTAVESAINLIEEKHREDFNRLARIAKDTAAGAVLVAAGFSVAVGIAVLWQPEAFKALFLYYRTHPVMIAALVLSLALSLVFIFAGPDKMLGINKHNHSDKS